MCRFLEAGRYFWRHPLLWLPLIVWAALTAMVHELTPNSPLYRFQMGAAHEEQSRAELAGANLRQKHSPRFVGATSDGMNVFSVSADHIGDAFGPIRQWDIRQGSLVTEYPLTESAILRNPVLRVRTLVHGDWLARRITIPSADKNWRSAKYETEFVHLPTKKSGPTIDNHWFGVSPNNRWIACGSWDITVLDLKTLDRRVLTSFRVPNNDFEKQAKWPAESRFFSEDGRLLAVSDRESVFVTDVDKDVCTAKLPVGATKELREWLPLISISPDNEAIAWECADDTVAAGIRGGASTKIPWAEIVGWNAQSNLVVIRRSARKPDYGRYHEPVLRLETWDWQQRACTHAWTVPAAETTFAGRKPIPARMTRDPTWAVRSPIAKKVVFARFIETRATPAWLQWTYETLCLGEPATHFIEVFALDSDTLALQSSYRFPVEGSWYNYDLYSLQFTDDGNLFFTDSNTVEIWSISPNSWRRSALWAGLATLSFCAVAWAWRFWRHRKRDTIAAPPTSANASEVSHAKT